MVVGKSQNKHQHEKAENSDSIFYRRDILIATSHKKEEAIGPVLQKIFQANIKATSSFDTDRFGTFSGEVERIGSPLDTARMKCNTASKEYSASLVISSEGSFGPHPTLFFVPACDEILLLNDYEHNIEIAVRVVSVKTNFSGKQVKTFHEVEEFATAIGFPAHNVILRKEHEDNSHIVKDITGWEHLSEVSKEFFYNYGSLFIETDMRAMNNPTRMSVIEQAAEKLAEVMASKCPECNTPGFDVGSVVPGLPCSRCGSTTKTVLKFVYVCKKCNYSKHVHYPENKLFEEPGFCDSCNP